MTENILELDGYGVAFGKKIILSKVDLKVPTKGNLVLLGPSGIGKSTLLRSICGINYSNPSFRTWGKAVFAGENISESSNKPILVSQNAKLMMSSILENIVSGLPERSSLQKNQQIDLVKRLLTYAGLAELTNRLNENVINLPLGQQRHLAILRTAAANPKLLCIDEPTTGVDEQYVEPILNYISKEAEKKAIIIILHNQNHAKKLKGMVALLSGGWVNEYSTDEHFYSKPRSKAGKQFVKTGSCPSIGPEVTEDDFMFIDKDSVELPPPIPKVAKKYVSDAFGPRNFLWLKKGLLAGTPQPGLVHDLNYDLKLLNKVGVTVLINLRKNKPDPSPMQQYKIKSLWFPIKDMASPCNEDAIKWCKQVSELLNNGDVVAYHCKAGLGRTGTMLVCQLIWEGNSALSALEMARQIEPRWVQSKEQVDFIENFEIILKTNPHNPQK